jgi:hypothetical protein
MAGRREGRIPHSSALSSDSQTGQPTIVADLRAYTVSHPTAVVEPDDYEPEGSWWNLSAVGDDLYTVNPNLGDFVRVSLNGDIERIVDLSAQYGHNVPTALTYHGNFYIANLTAFFATGLEPARRISSRSRPVDGVRSSNRGCPRFSALPTTLAIACTCCRHPRRLGVSLPIRARAASFGRSRQAR